VTNVNAWAVYSPEQSKPNEEISTDMTNVMTGCSTEIKRPAVVLSDGDRNHNAATPVFLEIRHQHENVRESCACSDTGIEDMGMRLRPILDDARIDNDM
jgi:hypothetical protein